jgi:hypothetical protein
MNSSDCSKIKIISKFDFVVHDDDDDYVYEYHLKMDLELILQLLDVDDNL